MHLSFESTVVLWSLQRTMESILCLRDQKYPANIQPVRIILSSFLRFQQVYLLDEALNNSWFFWASFFKIITIYRFHIVISDTGWKLRDFCFQSSEVIIRSVVKVNLTLTCSTTSQSSHHKITWIFLHLLNYFFCDISPSFSLILFQVVNDRMLESTRINRRSEDFSRQEWFFI